MWRQWWWLLVLFGCGGSGQPGLWSWERLPERGRADFDALSQEVACPCGDSDQVLAQCLGADVVCREALILADSLAFYLTTQRPRAWIQEAIALEAKGLRAPAQLSTADRPRMGSAAAPVEVVLFVDVQCPSCRQMSQRLQALQQAWPDEMSLVIKHFPLPRHVAAQEAAIWGAAAHRQGLFWPLFAAFYAHQSRLDAATMEALLTASGADLAQLEADARHEDVRAIVAVDLAEGEAASIPGTPAVFINGVELGDDMSVARVERRVAIEVATGAGARGVTTVRAGATPAPHVEEDFPGYEAQWRVLTPEQRAQLVRLGDAVLCPCKGAATSLNGCVRQEGKDCRQAHQVLRGLWRAVAEGMSDDVAMARVTAQLEAARRVHHLHLEGRPVKGAPLKQARVVLVEFADYRCGHCRTVQPLIDALLEAHPDVALVFKHFPLRMSDVSVQAAVASLAAHRQGHFWEMHATLFDFSYALERDDLLEYAEALGLDMARYLQDLDDPALLAQVQEDRLDGERAGLTGTPSFYIDGVRFSGSLQELSEALAGAGGE